MSVTKCPPTEGSLFLFLLLFDTSRVNLYRSKINFSLCLHFLDSSLSEALALVGCSRNSPIPSLAKFAPPHGFFLLGHFCVVAHSSNILASSRTSHILSGVAPYSGTIAPSLISYVLCLLLAVLLSLFTLTIPIEGCSYQYCVLRLLLAVLVSSFTLTIPTKGCLQ